MLRLGLRNGLSAILVGVIVITAVGCGGSDVTQGNPDKSGPSAKEALEDLANMLKSIAEQGQKPPAKPADLEPHEGVFLSGTLGIHQKRIVYVWGSGLTGGTAVIAYDANAETAGGYVLLQDGTVKQMSAAEFQSAPKAKKK